MPYRSVLAVQTLIAAFALAALPWAAEAQDAPLKAHYSGYSHGLNVVTADAVLTLRPADYKLQISYRLAGVVGALIHGDGTTMVDGSFAGSHPAPREFVASGHLRGNARLTQIDWQGGQPKLVQMVPAAETERDPVPVADQANTIDTMSAAVALVRQASSTGRCEGAMRTFDGRRLAEISARTVGMETLDATGRSSFKGPALRCDFQGRQLAGFLRDDDQEELRKPQQGSAWFARLHEGDPLIPVRIDFPSRMIGTTTLYIDDPR